MLAHVSSTECAHQGCVSVCVSTEHMYVRITHYCVSMWRICVSVVNAHVSVLSICVNMCPRCVHVCVSNGYLQDSVLVWLCVSSGMCVCQHAVSVNLCVHVGVYMCPHCAHECVNISVYA